MNHRNASGSDRDLIRQILIQGPPSLGDIFWYQHQRTLYTADLYDLGVWIMMQSGDRIKGGDMPTDLIEKVDGLLDQFMGIVNNLVEERKIQRGIVRSQNPSSIVARSLN